MRRTQDYNEDEHRSPSESSSVALEHNKTTDWRSSSVWSMVTSVAAGLPKLNEEHRRELGMVADRHRELMQEMDSVFRGYAPSLEIGAGVTREVAHTALERLRVDQAAMWTQFHNTERDIFQQWTSARRILDSATDTELSAKVLDIIDEQDNDLNRYRQLITRFDASFERRLTGTVYDGASAPEISACEQERTKRLNDEIGTLAAAMNETSSRLTLALQAIQNGSPDKADAVLRTGEQPNATLFARLDDPNIIARNNALSQLSIRPETAVFDRVLQELPKPLSRAAASAAIEMFVRAPGALSEVLGKALSEGRSDEVARFVMAFSAANQSGVDVRTGEAATAFHRWLRAQPEHLQDSLGVGISRVRANEILEDTREATVRLGMLDLHGEHDRSALNSAIASFKSRIEAASDTAGLLKITSDLERLRNNLHIAATEIGMLSSRARHAPVNSDEQLFLQQNLLEPFWRATSAASVEGIEQASRNIANAPGLYQTFKLQRLAGAVNELSAAVPAGEIHAETRQLHARWKAHHGVAASELALFQASHAAGNAIPAEQLIGLSVKIASARLEGAAVVLHSALVSTHETMRAMEEQLFFPVPATVRLEVESLATRLQNHLKSEDYAAVGGLMNSTEIQTLSSRVSEETTAQQNRQLIEHLGVLAASAAAGSVAAAAAREAGALLLGGAEAVAMSTSARAAVIGLGIIADGAAQAFTASAIYAALPESRFDLEATLKDSLWNIGAGAAAHGLASLALARFSSPKLSALGREGLEASVAVTVGAATTAGVEVIRTGELPAGPELIRDTVASYLVGRVIGNMTAALERAGSAEVRIKSAELQRRISELLMHPDTAHSRATADTVVTDATNIVRTMEREGTLSPVQTSQALTLINTARVVAECFSVGRVEAYGTIPTVRYPAAPDHPARANPEVARVIEESRRRGFVVNADERSGAVRISTSSGEEVARLTPDWTTAVAPDANAASPDQSVFSRFAQRAFASRFSETPALDAIWREAATGKPRTREGFDSARDAFWKIVNHGTSSDAQIIRDILREAGYELRSGEQAPMLKMRIGAKTPSLEHADRLLSIDHKISVSEALRTNPDLVLDSRNLEFLSGRDNSFRGNRYGDRDYPVGDRRNKQDQ